MDSLIDRLKSLLGDNAVISGSAITRSRLGRPLAVVRPKSTSEVSAILQILHEAGQAVVPWGGLTGLVEGTKADEAVALSLERMNRIENIDAESATMTVEAGCILQNVCEAAEKAGLFFPLDLGARGSATIGGNVATNAGGNRVLRFGMMRELVLGLEVVLADGTVLSSLNALIKNNAGYDLKQLFIGSEGTLGIVTRAVLRLRPKPTSQNVAMLAVDSFDRITPILRRLEMKLGGGLSAFEVMWADFYRLVTTPPALGRAPVPLEHPFFILVEALGSDPEDDLVRFERALAAELESEAVADAVVARSKAECDRLWGLRDDVGQVGRLGPFFAFDVSLRQRDMEGYVARVRTALTSRWPDCALVVFGHLGDGNLHLIAGVGDGSSQARASVEAIVYDELRACGGSVSAEHGIGLEKRSYLSYSRNPEELALMRALKQTLDPRGILNPGKVIALP